MKIIRNGQEKIRKIFDGNTAKGYIDEFDDLYGFKSDGYAYLITINVSSHQAISKLKRWLKTNYDKT